MQMAARKSFDEQLEQLASFLLSQLAKQQVENKRLRRANEARRPSRQVECGFFHSVAHRRTIITIKLINGPSATMNSQQVKRAVKSVVGQK